MKLKLQLQFCNRVSNRISFKMSESGSNCPDDNVGISSLPPKNKNVVRNKIDIG